jgi:C_GCAxxG_C_C family probable redox protein
MEGKDVGELAMEYYLKGLGCAESILHAFNDLKIIEVPEALLKASTGFGTGFGGKGSTCGAITGPILAVGLIYGRLRPEEGTEESYKRAKMVVDAYEQKFKTTQCAEVTKVWREKGEFMTPGRRKFCGSIVRYMARETEKILRTANSSQ